MKEKNTELSNERIKKNSTRIAKAINMLEVAAQEIRWACNDQEWNDEIVFQIEEAITKLGCSLATLVRWFDPDESFNDD